MFHPDKHSECASPSPIEIALKKLETIAVTPEKEDYKELQKIYNPAYVGNHPAFIALPKNVDDIKKCLLVASETGVQVTVKSGGHSIAGYSNIGSDGFVISMKHMNKVTVVNDTVVVEAGARWKDVYEKLDGSGFVAVGGCCPTVGVAGYILGGGYGLQSRSHGGLGSDKAVSFTMVTAKGDAVVTASKSENNDLFWALRGGGGGNFGVMVDVTLNLSPSPQMFFWSKMQITGVDNIKNTLSFVNKNLQRMPKELNLDMLLQKDGLTVSAVYSDRNKDAVTTILDGIQKERQCTSSSSFLEFVTNYANLHGYVEYASVPVYIKGAILDAIPEDLSTYFANLQIPLHQYMNVTFVHMGGDINSHSSEATAFPYRTGQYSYFTYCQYRNPVEKENAFKFASMVYDHIKSSPNVIGSYVNYMDRHLEDWQHKYYGRNYHRLCEIKKKWNPVGSGCLRFPQEIGSV